MKKWVKHKVAFVVIFVFFLISIDSYVLLKAFVLPEKGTVIAAATNTTTESTIPTDEVEESIAISQTEAVVSENSYSDENIQVTIEEEVVENTTVYIVDIQVSDPSYLQTALAQGTYGRNIKEETSTIAEENQAIIAINGDFYGFRSTGYVLRNGVLYRDNATENQEDLVIDSEGNFSIINESNVSAQALLDSGAQQVLSFGPALVVDGELAVDTDTEVGQSMSSNPRTAIGQIGENHYVMIVSDGRTEESEGLSLYQLAEVFQNLGASTAYNLDGGGSSTLYFNGEIINTPVGGQGTSERSVSDIVYIGY